MKGIVYRMRYMGRLNVILIASAMLLATGCDDNPIEPEVPSVAGRVINAATGEAVAGAQVSIGAATVTTGNSGRFEFADLAPGSVTIHCVVAGYEDFEQPITVTSGGITHDISLIRIERFEFGDFALYAPASIARIRGIILALGGPDTRGFATASPFGAPVPHVEEAFQGAGQQLRQLADDVGFAVMGTSLAAMENGPDSDQLLISTLQQAAALSGRPELSYARLLLYGISGGGPEASGFTVRNTGQVVGLFLKVPASVELTTTVPARGVPTYIVLAENDAFIDNAAVTSAFETSRSDGALWALALEPGVPHHSLSPAQRELTMNWMREIIMLRLKTIDPLFPIDDSSGWLGDVHSGEIAPWGELDGDPQSASWFASRGSAEAWQAFIGKGGS